MIIGPELWPSEVSVGEVTYPAGGTLGPRWQHDVELVLVHEGTMIVTVDGRPRPTQRAGSVGLLLPGHREAFAFAPDRPTRHAWLQARVPALPDELADRLGRLPAALPTSTGLAALARSALDTARPAPSAPALPLLHALVTAALWRYVAEGEAQLSTGSGLVEEAREHLDARVHDRDFDLAALARACNVSAGHLARAFRREVGVSPIAYLWQRRVAVGVDLLANTGLPVGAIAERCGFKTVYHFSRRVKQATGAAPTEVRRRQWRSSPEIIPYENVPGRTYS
jgi:AraC-like DNA-binding protein